MTERKIILPGGPGLVGQNLGARLKSKGYANIVVMDKHEPNLAVLEHIQPDITAEYADLEELARFPRLYFIFIKKLMMNHDNLG